MIVDFSLSLNLLMGFLVFSPLVGLAAKKMGREELIDWYTSVAFASALVAVFIQYRDMMVQGPKIQAFLLEATIGSSIYIDNYSLFFAGVFVFLGLMASLFSIRDIQERKNEFCGLLLAMVVGMVGVAYAGDLFTLFLFWEMMSIASYVLVAFNRTQWEAVEASFKYLIMSAAGSATILFSMSIIYGMTGTLNIVTLNKTLASAGGEAWSYVAIALFITGFGVKAAIVPFHWWLADAHPAAPSPISAMLSGVVIKTGVLAILRSLFTAFEPSLFDHGVLLIPFGLITMTVGNFMALMQRDIKRLLAYSSILNIGYIVAGAGVGAYVLRTQGDAMIPLASLAIMGSLFHVLNHALGKGLLFLGSGCFTHEAKTRDLADLEGIGRKMPVTGTSFSIGLLTLAGVPPLAGFWSKLFIIVAAFGLPGDPMMQGVGIIMVLNALFSASYYLWVMQRVMLKTPKSILDKIREVPPTMILPIIVLAASCVAITIWLRPTIDFAEAAAQALIGR